MIFYFSHGFAVLATFLDLVFSVCFLCFKSAASEIKKFRAISFTNQHKKQIVVRVICPFTQGVRLRSLYTTISRDELMERAWYHDTRVRIPSVGSPITI